MPRPLRADEAGAIYHALNRGNARQTIFHKDDDYHAFEQVIAEGLEKYAVELIAYQWMPNHWHMVLSPQENAAMSAFLSWVTMTHTQRYHAHYETTGDGHVYQGRYKSFPVQDDEHFHVVCRYVERNALTADLIKRAEDWRWGSLWNWCGGKTPIKLAAWPVARLARWIERVNEVLTEKELQAVKCSIKRSSPFGSPNWIDSTAKRLKLESTLRPRGRPSKFAQTAN